MVLLVGRLAARVQSNIGIIRAGVSQGLTSQGIQALIRSTGQAGLRRTDPLAGIREVRGIIESGSRIRNTRLDRFPDPSRIAQSRGPMVSNFSYDVRFTPKGWKPGDTGDRYITVRSDRNLTPQDILNEAEEARQQAGDDKESGQIEDDLDMVVIGARRR